MRRNTLIKIHTPEEIEKHATFHGNLTKREADDKLKSQDRNCHLTRYSITREMYVLSVVNKTRRYRSALHHFDLEIEKVNDTMLYKLKGYNQTRVGYSTLLKHYQNTRLNRRIHGIGNGLRTTHTENQTEEVQSAVPTWQLELIGMHPSFHGSVSGEEAREKLMKAEAKRISCGTSYCFLTRYSNYRRKYVLAVLKKEKDDAEPAFQQFNIQIDKQDRNGYIRRSCEIEGTEQPFQDMYELLECYQTTPLSPEIKHIGGFLDADSNEIVRENLNRRRDYSRTPDRIFSQYDYPETPGTRYSGHIQHKISETQLRLLLLDDILHDENHGSILDRLFNIPDQEAQCQPQSDKNKFCRPSLQKLTRMEWQDEQGTKQQLKIIKSISNKWELMGLLLGQDTDEFDNYKDRFNNDNIKCCSRVLNSWIKNNGSPPEYPLTWQAVYDLLFHIENSELAERLKKALEANQIKLQKVSCV